MFYPCLCFYSCAFLLIHHLVLLKKESGQISMVTLFQTQEILTSSTLSFCYYSDLNMEQKNYEDEGLPPGWDNTYPLKEQVEHMLTPQ
uniref:Uncharacterized protein n=1 Tax=Lactuca sativa TaxID=4236 RepID=A0A9R1ULN8_LACSA|nr:hypothetical protein LSAT_V11C800416590 [Lactuca sativa]